jgi:ferredoxin
MKIKCDRETCIGVGNCVAIAPSVFALDNTGKVYVTDPTGADDQTIKEAAESCPVEAITLEDDSGNQIYP